MLRSLVFYSHSKLETFSCSPEPLAACFFFEMEMKAFSFTSYYLVPVYVLQVVACMGTGLVTSAFAWLTTQLALLKFHFFFQRLKRGQLK